MLEAFPVMWANVRCKYLVLSNKVRADESAACIFCTVNGPSEPKHATAFKPPVSKDRDAGGNRIQTPRNTTKRATFKNRTFVVKVLCSSPRQLLVPEA